VGLAAFVASVTLAVGQGGGTKSTAESSRSKPAQPTVEKIAPSLVPNSARNLSADLVQTLVDTAAQVGASNADSLHRRVRELPANIDSPAQEGPFREIATDAKQSILEAFGRSQAVRREPEAPRSLPPAHWGQARWPGPESSTIAVVLSIVALLASITSFIFVRSSTRKALRDAGLL
jgi:hypothetical protein